jgi:hypothetical protein
MVATAGDHQPFRYFREEDDFTHARNERLAVKSFYAAIDHWYIVINEVSRPD